MKKQVNELTLNDVFEFEGEKYFYKGRSFNVNIFGEYRVSSLDREGRIRILEIDEEIMLNIDSN